MSPTVLRVLISGGGIAGNALAFWLAKQGHIVTVVERFPHLRATGLQLDLRGPGIQVLKKMGLEEAFRARAAPEQGMQVVDKSGRRRAYFPANKSGSGKQSLTSEFEIMRGDLCRLLYDAARGCENPPRYVFGTAVETFEQNKNGSVEVRFENGQRGSFDLLVGADGQWSRTRRMMLGIGPADGMQRIPGFHIAYFTMPLPMQKGEECLATTYMAPGRRGFMTRRHSPDKVQVMLTSKTDPDRLQSVPRGDVEQEKEAMADIFRGAGWITDDIIEGMRAAEDFYCERIGLVKVPRWSSGHVALVGDAAHCPTVLSGMGTTCAMVGAYILAGEIGRHSVSASGNGEPDGLEAALKRYEETLRPLVDRMQEGILERADGQWLLSGSAFGVELWNCLMGLVSFFRINIAEVFGIRENVKGWNLPDYEVLRE
ncbi:uncharacterized protein P884DRAFT_257607 [Thermothelomyces heterothallicus CBS 202.75]|uniref:uncharacterized protein n=1 Tax=Thermothelomyces heterothallicus CBS 202.75 TaxID=1149848 RepID=UPI0037425C9E